MQTAMADGGDSGRAPRLVCERCRRPRSVCYCAALPRLDTTTRIVILQHPRERDMPIGTARMASLCLPGATLHVGYRWDDHLALRTALADPQRPPILLYPGAGARDILAEPPAGPVTLVVVDGTWSQAKNLVRDSAVLSALPRYAFHAEPSQYRIRREPRVECVSTIEALMYVLGVLERDPATFRALLAPLHAMVDAHLAHRARVPATDRYRRPRARVPIQSRLPSALTSRWPDLVCVVGEANAWPYRDGQKGLPDELVHWVACRPSTGELFEAIVAPEHPLSPSTSAHIGIDASRLRGGMTRAELTRGFARFLRPTDIICSWGYYASGLFRAIQGVLPEGQIDLRAVAHQLSNRKLGTLEEFVASTAPPAAESRAEGRAGLRLGLLVRLLESWRAL